MQTKRKLKRYVIAVVMLFFATIATVMIKDTVDSLNPENSLPIINVSVGYNPPYVVRAGYEWKFGLKKVRSPFVSASDTPLMVTDCYPGENIVINFSAPFEFYNLYRAEGLANEDFTAVYNRVTPGEEGIYVYKIEAVFEKGTMAYYFAVQVKQAGVMS